MKSGNRWHAFIFHPTTWSNRRGAALLIALTFLVLLSAVVLALFGTTRTDRQNASTFATGQETMRLADAAVNLVQGQIRDATIQPRVGWASQPGMIRTFGTSGNATTAYKLYSSDEMVVSNFGKTQIDAETTAMSTWNLGANATSYNALYCDLNSPAAVRRPQPGDESQTEDALVFPIADPAAIGAVEGFSANSSVAGTVLGNATTRRLPMPVKWIYVLRDGQMTAPTSGDASKVNFSDSVVPTQSNPIVGRIAFWADDETCKLNINTASEGSFWDAPKASTLADSRMSISIPVAGEFHRIAGHPATTSLSPALRDIIPAPEALFTGIDAGRSVINNSGFPSLIGSGGDEFYNRYISYINLTPRINWQTTTGDHFTISLTSKVPKNSRAGTRRTAVLDDGLGPSTPIISWGTDPEWREDANLLPTAANYPNDPIVPDGDRLYATSDELLFRPDRQLNNSLLTATEVSRRDFFLTANSRAPETTLFGTPRISLWPINTLSYTSTPLPDANQPDRNAKDRLINFCATAGNKTYSFERSVASQDGTATTTSTSSTDLQRNSLATVRQPADSTTADSSLPRNRALVDYLRNLGRNQIPAAGGSFAAKWGSAGLDRAIAQAFDIMRAKTSSDYVSLGSEAVRFAASFINPRKKLAPNENEDHGSGPRGYVLPAQLADSPESKGAGATLHVTEVPIIFMASEIENTYNATGNNSLSFEFDPGIAGTGDTTPITNIFSAIKVVETTAPDGRPTWRHDPSSMKTLSVNRSSATSVKFEFRGIFKETSNGDTVSYELQQGELKVIDPSGSPTPNEGAPADPTPPLPLPPFDPGTQASIDGTALDGDLLLGSAGPPVIQTKGNRGAFERILIEPANPITIATGFTNLPSSNPGFLLNALDHYKSGSGFVYKNNAGNDVTAGQYDNFSVKAGFNNWSPRGFKNINITNNSTILTGQQTTKVRAFLLPQLFNANPTPLINAPGMQMELLGGNDLKINGTSLFRATAVSRFGGMVNHRMHAALSSSLPNHQYQFVCAGSQSIYSPILFRDMFDSSGPNNSINPIKFPDSTATAHIDSNYPFVSEEIPVTGMTMNFEGALVRLRLKGWGTAAAPESADVYQTINLRFPSVSSLAVPQHLTEGVRWERGGALTYFTNSQGSGGTIVDGSASDSGLTRQTKDATYKFPIRPLIWGDNGGFENYNHGNTLALWKRMRGNGNSQKFTSNIIRPGDVVLSMRLDTSASGPTRGDLRLLALQTTVPESWFTPGPDYGQCTQQLPGNAAYSLGPNGPAFRGRFGHTLQCDSYRANAYGYQGDIGWKMATNGNSLSRSVEISNNSPSTLIPGITFGTYARPLLTLDQQGVFMAGNKSGDWASGVGSNPDGAYLHSPDSGSASTILGGYYGFIDAQQVRYVETGKSYEPNRSVPSGGFLGSILTTDNAGTPQGWQSLLFNPSPSAASGHPGFASPRDHLFLDNFWMPVADPYPISDPLSTAGKVNLNAQMLPFTNLERTTALRGALKALMVGAIDDSLPNYSTTSLHSGRPKTYKMNNAGRTLIEPTIRFDVDRDETIKALNQQFTDGEIYPSASAVSEIPLVPRGRTATNVSSWWNTNRPTSDTLREQPYTALLSRVTTKSNTFNVHYRVQALRQPPRPGRNWAEWEEARDQVVGEYRGSTTIERFLDSNAKIPDYTDTTKVNLSGNYDPIDKFYRWRVLSQNQFAP